MKRVLFLSLLAIFVSPIANAGWVAVELLDIRAAKQSKYWMQVRDFSNPDGCASSDFILLTRTYSSGFDDWRLIHELLLKGFLENKPMEVRTAGCSAEGFPEIDGVLIKNR